MNRNQFISLLFLSVFLLSATFSLPFSDFTALSREQDESNQNSSLAKYPASSSIPAAPPLPEGPTKVDDEYLYKGLGTLLSTTEYAQGTNDSQEVTDLDYGENHYGEIRHPAGWTGYELIADVYNLVDNMTFIDDSKGNGDFESGSGSLPSQWTWSTSGLPSNESSITYYHDWGSSYAESGTYGARVWHNTTTSFTWETTYYYGISHTVNLNRDNVEWAKLTFDANFKHLSGQYTDYDELSIYVEVGGISYILVCERYCPEGDGWYTITLPIPFDDVQQWSTGTIDVKLGMGIDFNLQVQPAAWALDFDDVILWVKGHPNPAHSSIQLRLNGTSSWTGTSYGSGTISMTGTWTNPMSSASKLWARWSTANSASRNVDFELDLLLKVKKFDSTEQQTGPEGTKFVAKNATSPTWTAWFQAKLPYPYQNYNLSLARPTTDWTLIAAIDPEFNDRTTDVNAASNSTHVNLPASVVTEYGWWNFTFTTTNQVTGIITNFASFRISPGTPNTLTISATFGMSSGQANLTLYNPNGISVSDQTRTLIAATTSFTNIAFNDGDTYPAGKYTLCVSYDDGPTPTQESVGFLSKIITVVHDTQLTPAEDPVEVTYDDTGYYYVRVRFNDTDTTPDTAIIGATVNGTVAGNPLSFGPAGGWYEAQIPKSLLDPGDYVLNVDANKTYYLDASTNINLQIRSETSLTSPSPGLTVAYDETFTIQVYYYDVYNDTGVTSASIVTTGWPSYVVTPNGTAGWYNVTIDTNDKSKPATYQLALTASKSYYQEQTLTLTIVIRERNTQLTTTSPPTIPIDEAAEFQVYLYDLDASGTLLPTNASSGGRIHLSVWYSNSPFSDTTITEDTGGIWNISLDTSSLTGVGQYTFTVKFYWFSSSGTNDPFYGNRTQNVIVNLRQISTTITYEPPSPEPWGNDMNITISYAVDDPASSKHLDTLIINTISCTLNGISLVYSVDFNWQSIGGGQYQIQIYASELTQVATYKLIVQVSHASADYLSASRTIYFDIRGHLTQTIIDPPDPTPYGSTTDIIVDWTDIDADSTLTDTELDYLRVYFRNGTFIIQETSLQFTLDTSTWLPKRYNLTIIVYPLTSEYISSSGNFPIQIRTHKTAAVVPPLEQTPWGWRTEIIIQWTDLDTGGSLSDSNLRSSNPIEVRFENNTFITYASSLQFWLDTRSWHIKTYNLTVTVFAKTTPARIYNDATSLKFKVNIRIHRTEIIALPPAPTAWGKTTLITIQWRDLDNDTTLDTTYLNNIMITNCPGPDQGPFGLFTFTIDTSDDTQWTIRTHTVTVEVYADTTPYQRFQHATRNVDITIRAHFVSVTVDPPQSEPWGDDTHLVVHWRDQDFDADIAEGNLDNVTVEGSAPGLPYTNYTHLTFDLPTNSWSVNSYDLNVWVYGGTKYYNISGPVTVTIRAHATRLDVTPPSATPWGNKTSVILQWYDLDDATYIVGNIDHIEVTNGPDLITHTHGTLTFPLDTSDDTSWQVGSYTVTVTLFSSSLDYQDAASPMIVTIRIHYTNVVVQPRTTPWGEQTYLIIQWRDLDWGNSPINPTGNLSSIEVYRGATLEHTDNQLTFWLDTSSMPPWNIGQHTITVWVYATSLNRKYADESANSFIEIRGHRVNVVVIPPPPIPYDGSFDIIISWEDIDAGGFIDPSTNLKNVTVTGIPDEANLPYYNYTHLTFTLSVSGWARVDHTLTITVYPLDDTLYTTEWSSITVVLRKHNIVSDVDPIPSIPYANNTWFTLYVNDSDTNTFLIGSIVELTIQVPGKPDVTYDETNWASNVINVSDGEYRVKLQSSSWNLGSYTITIQVVTTDQYYDGSVKTSAKIRQLRTALTYTPPSQIPWDEEGNLTISFFVDDSESGLNGNPLDSATITVLGPWTKGVDYLVIDHLDGTYTIIFTTNMLNEPNDYPFTITSHYDSNHWDGQLTATLTVRPLLTTLTYTQIPNAPYLDDVNISVSYLVFDGESEAHYGDKIPGATIVVTGLYGLNLVYGVDYTYAWIGAEQKYLITIDSSAIQAIGEYWIKIEAHYNIGTEYFDAEIPQMSFKVRAAFASLQILPIDAQAWGDNFTIIVLYLIRDDYSTRDGWPIPGYPDIIEIIDPSTTLYNVEDIGGGYYRITINSTIFGPPGSWTVTINTTWGDPEPPYQPRSQDSLVYIENRPTSTVNTQPGTTGYADNILVDFNYLDVLRSNNHITNSTTPPGLHVFLSIYWKNRTSGLFEVLAPDAWWTQDLVAQEYSFRIFVDADYFGDVNKYFDFIAYIEWESGIVPYYSNCSFTFRVYILGTPTVLSIPTAPEKTPWGDLMNFTVNYQRESDQVGIDNSTEFVHMELFAYLGVKLIAGFASDGVDTYNSHWWVTDIGGGDYEITLNTSFLGDPASYLFLVNITWPGDESPYYAPQSGWVAGQVRAINTALTYRSSKSDYYWGENLEVYAYYIDLDHDGKNVTDPVGFWGLTFDIEFSGNILLKEQLPGGAWHVIFETYTFNWGYIDFNMTAQAKYHFNKTLEAGEYIKQLPLSITLLSDSIVDLPYAATTTIKISLMDYWGDAVTDDNIVYLIWAGTEAPYPFFNNEYNGTYWINVALTENAGRYSVEIWVDKPNCLLTFQPLTFNILRGGSKLDAFGLPSPYIVYIGDLFNLTVTYTDLFGGALPGTITISWECPIAPFVQNGILTETGIPGVYFVQLDSTGFQQLTYTFTLYASADPPNVQPQVLAIQIDIRWTPVKLTALNDITLLECEFDLPFNATIFLNDTYRDLPLPGKNVTYYWGAQEGRMIDIGGGWYSIILPANRTASRYTLRLVMDTAGYEQNELIFFIEIVQRTTLELSVDYAFARTDYGFNESVDVALLNIPIGDTLYLYMAYDYNTSLGRLAVPETECTPYARMAGQELDFIFDNGYYKFIIDTTLFELGDYLIEISFTSQNYQSKSRTWTIRIQEIPTRLSIIDIQGATEWDQDYMRVYIGDEFAIIVQYWDTWHNLPITGANITHDFTLGACEVTELGEGAYQITGSKSSLGEIGFLLTINSLKTVPLQHQSQILSLTIHFSYSPTFVLLSSAGLISAVAIIMLVIGYLLWVKVFSIPWEVRRLRSLAKKVEKDETFDLGGKDYKRFRERGLTMEDKVKDAMTPIGITPTSAMVPAAVMVEEVTATEEDILAELDKIPGLGPEEKAVLATEMRKIPRKDRIWFLDDLRRQMGTRRMDFLTKREPTPKAPPVEPAPKPEEAPPLEEVEPKEPPPPDEVYTEDRIAPTVRPPEERVLPPVPKGVEAEIKRELDKIPGLDEEEKQTLIDHLKYLSKDERKATYQSLRQSAEEGDK